MTLEQTKDFDYWVGLTSSDGTNVSAKDRAAFLTELKKRYFNVAKENMKILELEQRVSALEIENEEMGNLNKELTEEINRLIVDLETLRLHDEEEIGILQSENKDLHKQLEQSKEILRMVIDSYNHKERFSFEKDLATAEQFLKENE